eukprot:TCONS_00015509-protein
MQRSPTCENCQRNFELRDYQPIGPRIPLLLKCGHTFCEGCLTKTARLHQEIQCFKCGVKQTLEPRGEKGVQNLLPNIYMLGVLLFNRRAASCCNVDGAQGCLSVFGGIKSINQRSIPDQEDTPVAEANVEPVKDICEECSKKQATCLCKNCENTKFCDGCFVQVHRASKTLNKHSPFPIDYTSTESMTCTTHNDRTLEFYDKDTKKAICALCIISETYRTHNIVPITEIENSEEESSTLDEAADKAKETLKWLEISKKSLSESLPDEVANSYHLVSSVQAEFLQLHTLLLKRQLEIMEEASKDMSEIGSVHQEVQNLTIKIKEMKKTMKDYEMVKDDKKFKQLKGQELVDKLNGLADQPCIYKHETLDESVNFQIQKDVSNTLKSVGSIEKKQAQFRLLKVDELTDEEKEPILDKYSSDEKELNAVQENEIYQKKLEKKKVTPLMMIPQTGHYELVYLTHTRDPLNFMVQRCADKDRLQVMMTALNKYCRHSNDATDRVYNIDEGDIVCARYTQDHNWYRAQCVSAFCPKNPGVVPNYNNSLPVEVLYIDYGNSEWIPLNNLRKMKESLIEIPAMAVNCSLMDIVPPFKAVVWPERSIKAFNSLTGDRPMLMNIRDRVPGKLLVDLRRPDDEEPTNDDDRPVSVRDALVFLEVACIFSPSSFPNADIHKSAKDFPLHIPFNIEQYVDVTATHIVDYKHLYLQRLDSPVLEEQTSLSKLYKGRNKRAWKIDWPYRNLVCAARFSGDQTWYRAKVRNVNHDETVVVEYIDFGNEETLPFTDIKKIPDMYLKLPRQCVKVSLYGIENVVEDEEAKKIRKFLDTKVLNQALVCLVKDINAEEEPEICLYDTSTSQDININELLNNLDVLLPQESQTDETVNTANEPPSEPENLPQDDTDKVSVKSDASSKASCPSQSSNLSSSQSASTITPFQVAPFLDKETLLMERHEASSFPTFQQGANKDSTSSAPTSLQETTRNDHNVTPQPSPAFPQYMRAVFPKEEKFKATGVYVDDDANLHLHVMIDDDNILERIMQKLNKNPAKQYKKHPKDTSHLQINQAALGRFSQDGFWYRVRIMEIMTPQIVKIHFIDFGNTENAHISQLFEKPKFLEVPAQCLSTKLANVSPSGNKWKRDAIQLLKEKIEEKQLDVRVEGDRTFIIGDGEDLSLMLVNKGFASVAQHNPPAVDVTSEPSKDKSEPPSENRIVEELFSTLSHSTDDAVSEPDHEAPSPAFPHPDDQAPTEEISNDLNTLTLSESPVETRLTYTEQTLPDVGVRFDVNVTQVDRPDLVYIQRASVTEGETSLSDDSIDHTAFSAYEDLTELWELSENINSDGFFGEDAKVPSNQVKKGMACIGRYSSDGQLYRALVLRVDHEEGVADLEYVDYGTKETVPIESIKPISHALLSLPVQSSKVCVYGLKPRKDAEGKKLHDSDWTVETMKEFYNMVANKRLIAEIIDQTISPPTIHLYDRCLREDSTTGQTDDVLIGQLMQNNNLAEYEI